MYARQSFWLLRGAAAAALLLACNAASAQHATGFEAPGCTGSALGIDLNGQDGFYNPDPATSISAKVYTYAGNALGIPPNPSGGGDQFVGAEGPGGSFFARSQKDIPFGTGTGTWRLSVDVAITFSGVLPTGQYIGSVSLVPLEIAAPANQSLIALASWPEPITATSWNADFVHWPASGGYVIGAVPDTAFQNLMINHWYRWSITFDFDTHLVMEISITDLTTGTGGTYNPTDWYLAGGAAGLPAPEGFRLFGGNSTYAGNTTCWDNLEIVQVGACPEDVNGDNMVDVLDLLAVLAAWGATSGPEDINGDGIVDVLDLLALLAAWGPC